MESKVEFTRSSFSRISSWIILNGKILASDDPILLEPLATELLVHTDWSDRPNDCETIFVGNSLSIENVAGDGETDVFSCVEDSTSGGDVHVLHGGFLDGPADSTLRGVDDLESDEVETKNPLTLTK